MRKARLATTACFLLVYISVFAQKNADAVLLRSGTVKLESNLRQSYIDTLNNTVLRFNNKAFAILQFESIPSEVTRKWLSQNGVELLNYIPNSSYTVTFTGNLNSEILKQAHVKSIGSLTPKQKMEAHFAAGQIPIWAVKIAGTVDVSVSFPKTFSASEVATALKKMNFDVIGGEYQQYRILLLRIASNRLNELASLPFIEYVQPTPPPAQNLNYPGLSGARANVLNSSFLNGGKGLNGEGVTVGIGDDGDIQEHVDFRGRLIDRAAAPVSLHAHHTSGTLAGGGNIQEAFHGFASRSSIVSQYFTGILSDASTYVNDYGMVVTNNSYGNIVACDYHGTYDLYSSALDQMAIDLPYLQNVFAAGNSGASTCAPFGPGFRTVLGGYQTAKNVLTVGATTDSGAIAFFSSRGPVKDGRTKPEITAMGQLVASDWPFNSYSFDNGTSMAAPAVTGGLALLYQEYRKLNSGNNPKSGLMKALVCNGATDKGNTGPDYEYGYGWMNLARSVDMLDNNHYFIASVANSSTNTHTITVPANTAQLKVMLYWNDPAASALSSQALINDLDLNVADPSSAVQLPLILDTTVANIGNTATTGVDHINNMEQVLINNPVAGSYNLNVRGTAINQNPNQEYYLVYDIIPVQLKLTSPIGGERWAPLITFGYPMRINWEANGFSSGTCKLEFSADNGTTWSTIASGLDVNRSIFTWYIPDTATNQALIRITKDISGESSTSKPFTIIGNPGLSLATTQCEGYFNIIWNKISGATDYEVMMLKGDSMTSVGFTTDTVYSVSGLSKDSTYWLTVRARINGSPGIRAYAISRQPNSGTCAGSISDNDLKIDAIIAPVSGRKFTSTQLSSASAIIVRIKNLDDAPATNFKMAYSINGNPWIIENVSTSIPAGGTYTYTFSTTADLSLPGNYNLSVAVTNNAADPVTANDTAWALIRSLDNQPLDLTSAYIDDMESAPNSSYTIDTIGLSGLDRYDFTTSNGNGRLRTFVNSGMAYSGSNALTLDDIMYDPAGNTNYLTGTYNLSNYNANSDNIRLDFQYNNHGQSSNANNRVWVRGSDSQPWLIAYSLDDNENQPGTYKKTGSIDLSNILASNGQNFGTSFQVRWGQFGILPATDLFNANGYTFDDIRVYQVFNDLQMISIDSPLVANCALSNATPVKISIKNSASSAITNIPVKYRINNGGWVTDNIPGIAANSILQFTFSQTADFSASGNYTLQTVVDYSGDSFKDNDTATITLINSPVINSFPYLENFETGSGYWYTGGTNVSWEYGTPSSTKINRAASGAKAWKTRLAGNYNDMEFSYLYSPCYDISSLTKPTLSFSVALDLENCGSTLCDGAWVEYSSDGKSWHKLSLAGIGTNWYNDATDTLWSIQNYTNWHVATAPLPVGLTSLHLRFAIHSDQATNYEGIAVDDIHIYDNLYGIYDSVTMASPVTNTVHSSAWTDFLSVNNKLVASVKPGADDLGPTDVQAYIFNGPVRFTPTQYYHNRNITIKPLNNPVTDSVSVRFYFLDSETDSLINASGCGGCSKPSSAYELGISKYDDPDRTLENGSIGDNSVGIWSYIASDNAMKVPFDKGYYAEYKVKDFSEFWLNNGGINNNQPLPVKLLDFTAEKTNNTDVFLKWTIVSEINVRSYEIQVARGTSDLQTGIFSKIGAVSSAGNTIGINNYTYLDNEQGKTGVRYYRIKMINTDGSYTYSPIRSVIFDEAGLWAIFPNPSEGIFYFTYQLNNNQILSARILDAKGSIVKEYQVYGSGFLQKLSIDLSGSNYSSGTYLLQVMALGQQKTYKLYKK